MSLTLKERQSAVRALAKKYKGTTKKKKKKLIDELIALTGYSRYYAKYVLRNYRQTC